MKPTSGESSTAPGLHSCLQIRLLAALSVRILAGAVLRRLHGCRLTCVPTAGWYKNQLEMRSHQWISAEAWTSRNHENSRYWYRAIDTEYHRLGRSTAVAMVGVVVAELSAAGVLGRGLLRSTWCCIRPLPTFLFIYFLSFPFAFFFFFLGALPFSHWPFQASLGHRSFHYHWPVHHR